MEKLFIPIKSKWWKFCFDCKKKFLDHFSTTILQDGNKYRLKLKNIGLKDAGEISFQCGDLKDSCKLTVKECMWIIFKI